MYSYQYPRPAYTADTIIFCKDEILLIRRGNEPYKDMWALPGGFVNEGETSAEAAVRELQEETGVNIGVDTIHLVGIYDTIGRDPRGWTISAAYAVSIDSKPMVGGYDDAAEAMWFSIKNLPELAFDHKKIISDAIASVGL